MWVDFRGISIISSGLLLGLVASLAALPIYSRLYTVEQFGSYGLAIAIISVGSTFAALRLDQAILVAPPYHKYSLAICDFFFGGIFSLISFSISLIFTSVEFSGAVALGIFSNTVLQASYALIFSEKKYGLCGIINAARNITFIVPQLILPNFLPSWDMIDGIYLQSVIISIWSLSIILRQDKGISPSIRFLVGYKDFIIYNTPHALLNSLSHNLPYYLGGALIGEVVLGYYAIVDRILKTPISLFSQTIRQYFVKKFSEAGVSSKILRYSAARFSSKMLLIAAPFFFTFFFIPISFFQWLLGPSWGEVGSYFCILAIGYLFVFSNPPVSGYLIAIRRSDILLKLQLVELAIKILCAIILFLIIGGKWVFLSVTLALVVYNALCFFIVRSGFGLSR